MKETRKQKIERQQGAAADRAFDPIRAAIDSGELVITPLPAGGYVRAVAGHTAVHYGSHGAAECGADYQDMALTTVPANVTCRTCRGWLPIVAGGA